MERCLRFHVDGSPCTNETDNVDGWCRESGCPGFQRSRDAIAPEVSGFPKGTDRQIHESGGDCPLKGVSIAEVDDVRLTMRALDSFRFHHGGGIDEARSQLWAMLEDFILQSVRTRLDSGYLQLTRSGFSLMLSPDLDAVVGYSTLHRERTWEQVKIGVPSRIRHKARRLLWIDESVPVPEPGPPVSLECLADTLDPGRIFLTARVRKSFVKIHGLSNTGRDASLDNRIRRELTGLASGTLTRRDDGVFEVDFKGHIWLVSPDAQTLIGVKPAPRDTTKAP
jgi:hypothetical protein